MNRKGVREEFVKGSGKATVIGSVFLSTLMILSVLAVSASTTIPTESTSINQSKSMGNPLQNDKPLKIIESNNYYDEISYWKNIFAVSWITNVSVTGRVVVGDNSGFDPSWEGAFNYDDRGSSVTDDVHHCTVVKYGEFGTPHFMQPLTIYYYYIESPIGKIWGEDPAAPGEAKLKSAGGTAFELKTATDTNAVVEPPIRGYVYYGPTGEYRNDELVYITAHRDSNPDDEPGWLLSQLTQYGGPSASNGFYQVFPKFFQKGDYSGPWTIATSDPVRSEGEGSNDGVGYADGTWPSSGALNMPDIVLWPPPPRVIANFMVEPEDSPCGEPAVWDTVYFNSTSDGGPTSREDLYYEWDFGDGEAAEGYGYDGCDNVTHDYYTSGIYAVTLEITDDGSPPSNDTTTQDVKIWLNRVSTTPLDIREASVKGNKARICWHTCINTTGYVMWGVSPEVLDNTATDIRGDENYTDDTHICRIIGLTEYTKYYYKVISGSKTYDDFGQPFNYTTGRDFIHPPSRLIRGYVYKSDGVTPADGVLVYMYMERPSGEKSLLECVYTNSNGFYSKEKNDFRSSDGEHMFEYTTGIDWVDQFAEGATEGTDNQTVILTEDNLQWAPDMILSGSPPDKTAPTSTATSQAESATSTWDVNYTAEDDYKGLDYVELWYNYTPDATPGNIYTYYATDNYTGELEVEDSFTFTATNGTGYYHFYTRGMDIAGNYEPVPKQPDCTTYDEAGNEQFELELHTGLNLISIPLNATDPTPGHPTHDPGYSAKDLINDINDDGGSCTIVSKYVEGGWISFYDGDPESKDFRIKLWHGYFVKCSYGSPWTCEGTVAESEPVLLSAGLNLIGISDHMDDPTPGHPSHDPGYSAQDLINDINDDGGSCLSIYKWEGGEWKSFYNSDPESKDFRILRGVGYFVKCSNCSTWTP